MGLVNAVNRFDVTAGSDFASFAVPTVMGEVRRHFRDNGWSVKVPRRLKELHVRIGGGVTAEMAQRLGRAPNATELAAELDIDRQEVVEALVAGGSSYNTLSIDSGSGGDDDAPSIGDTLAPRTSPWNRWTIASPYVPCWIPCPIANERFWCSASSRT